MDTFQLTADELAERFGLTVRGDGGVRVHGVATLAGAGAGQLAFLANPRYRSQLADSGASVVVLREEDAAAAPAPHWSPGIPTPRSPRSPRCSKHSRARDAGVHASAVIDPDAASSTRPRISVRSW